MGPIAPIMADASSPEEHAQNRRVEFRFPEPSEVADADDAAGVLRRRGRHGRGRCW